LGGKIREVHISQYERFYQQNYGLYYIEEGEMVFLDAMRICGKWRFDF
jgi:hypothetical protein